MSNNPFAGVDAATKEIPSAIRRSGPPASALYDATIKAAYLLPSPWNKAGQPEKIDLTIEFELANGLTHTIRNTVLEGGTPTFINPKTKKEEMLYTYVQASHIIGAATDGKTFKDIYGSVQDAIVSIFNFDTRKDENVTVKMVNDLVGKTLLLGLKRKIDNKKQFDASTGKWMPLAERKETSEFGIAGSSTDRRTFTEMNSNEPATDVDKWEKVNKGEDWIAYKEVAATNGVPAGVTATPAETIHDFGTAN